MKTTTEQAILQVKGKPHRWVKGQSGNPGGRPKDIGITAVQIKMLDLVCPYDAKGRTWREYLAEKGLVLASEQSTAMDDLKDRLEGKVNNQTGITGDIILTIKHDR